MALSSLQYPSFLTDWSCKTGFGWKWSRLEKCFSRFEQLYFFLNVIIVLTFGPGYTCYISQWVLQACTWLSAVCCSRDFLPDLVCDSLLITLFRKPNQILYSFILLMFYCYSLHFHAHQQSVFYFAIIPKKTIFWLKMVPWLMKMNSSLLFHMQLCACPNYRD